ncbi:hypothetical protein [Frateuria terrea]|uniref:Uncharacterized protein n=1 Tax=Frateuria terrea TaxID=529704 RepID=A0A1H7A150_9GAMM|nr:hypothetical protein [Frateuria terrea]SEJ54755.1 hypothetical protein SAMN04487997_0169 [Frateuria terrea]SFP47690.1 hypothetical protein SAMN02927913_2221 [Frateuria terrea]
MGIQYEVTAITGKYTDRDGNEKNRYAKLGVVMETKNGPMLKLETIPLGWDGFAYLNEPRAKDEQPRGQRQGNRAPAQSPNDPEDLPF